MDSPAAVIPPDEDHFRSWLPMLGESSSDAGRVKREKNAMRRTARLLVDGEICLVEVRPSGKERWTAQGLFQEKAIEVSDVSMAGALSAWRKVAGGKR
ncbi:MAG: hypothetical protein KF874_06555 [Rhizobiaceae bacterium]|nr:hypothetical protein [Rhizobiaceae bacterium]